MLEIDLRGHIALVTGGTGELGRTMVRTLARCGADVAVHFHSNRGEAEALVGELQGMGVKAVGVQADVTREDSIAYMQKTVQASLGSPDILVNNAVIQYRWKTVLQQAVEDYEGQFQSSVLQNVLMAQAFVPAMVEKRWGRVISVSTECALQCGPYQSAYVAGKRGMDGLLRVLAREVGEHQVTVNQVAPGWMISDRVRREGTERQEGYESQVPLRRRGEDQDVANLIAYLASDLAGYITGAFIPVNGGNAMVGI